MSSVDTPDRALREQTIEECAKVAEDMCCTCCWTEDARFAAESIADAIRALPTQPVADTPDKQPVADDEHTKRLKGARVRLKSGEYDGVDLMTAWLAIDELLRLRAAPTGDTPDRVVVPREPTEEMIENGAEAFHNLRDEAVRLTGLKPPLYELIKVTWRAMLAAAPDKQQG